MEKPAKEKLKLKLKSKTPESESNYQQIHCAACNSEIPAANIHLSDKIAKCGECNVVFSFREKISGLLENKKIRQELIQPEGIDLFYFRDELEISIQQPWTALEVISLSFFPVFAILFSLLSIEKDISPFVIGFFWLGTFLSLLNAYLRSRHKVHLTIDDQYLSVFWRPKKFKKDKKYRIDEIDQLYIQPYGDGQKVRMILNGVEGQKHVTLISGLKSISKAHYLEQEIERYLGITDRVVPEEG